TGFAPRKLREEYNVRLMTSNLVDALYRFLRAHPNSRKISTHIASESYGAAIVLETARLILRATTKGIEKISLKSVIVGSAMIDVYRQYPILPFLASSFGIKLNSAKQCQNAILECRDDENS
ncbi:carboxypeptidase C, partial [Massospora cicadina]